MKIALAQIDMRLGDIEGICSRIADQARLAADQDAQLLCVPAPLLSGVLPGALTEYANYEHDLVCALVALAERVEPTGVVCLVPAVVPCEGGSLFEVFMLREGRAVPTRLTVARFHGDGDAAWVPPVFDVAGTRVAVTFDLVRDLGELPTGCDLVVYFQVNGFDVSDDASAAVASVTDGRFGEEVARAGVWMACTAPVGAFDDAVYTGGSFVMDDGGRVVAAAPCFTESLLVQDVQRGCMLPSVADRDLPSYNREEWLWEALRLYARDALTDRGFARAVVPLTGDLPSSLLAVLAVDALGPRNVIGVMVDGVEPVTPAQEARVRERVELAREVAANLRIRVVERATGEAARLMARDAGVPGAEGRVCEEWIGRALVAFCLADTARAQDAAVLSPLTKTDAALRPDAAVRDAGDAVIAPFGDVYLSALEFMARARNRASAVLPARLVCLRAVEDTLAEATTDAACACSRDASDRQRIASLLRSLEPARVDGALEAHVERNQCFEDIPLAADSPEATALLLMLVRRGEDARRRLPASPVVSARSFAERAWPATLAWSDLGRHGEQLASAKDLADAERKRLESQGDERGTAARGEILGLLGDLLGLTPEQQAELRSQEGQQRMRENIQRFEEQLQDAFERMAGAQGMGPGDGGSGDGTGAQFPFPGGPIAAGPGSFPFFSQN